VSSASRLTRLTDLLPSVLLQGQRSALMEMEFASSLTLSVYIRKYKLAVNQTLDAIQASADWLKRDQKDVEQVCSARQPLMCMYADGVRPVAEGEQVSLKLGSGLGSMGSSHSELKCKQKCNVSCGVPSDRACVIDSAIKRLQGRAKACGLHDMDTDHQTAQHHMVSLPPHLNLFATCLRHWPRRRRYPFARSRTDHHALR